MRGEVSRHPWMVRMENLFRVLLDTPDRGISPCQSETSGIRPKKNSHFFFQEGLLLIKRVLVRLG